jgi:hypothetical protein
MVVENKECDKLLHFHDPNVFADAHASPSAKLFKKLAKKSFNGPM